HDDEIGELVDLEAVEQANHLARQNGRQVEFPHQERDRLGGLEGVALDAIVDDRLGHRKRQEIENLGEHDQAQDNELFGAAMPPNVGEQIALHGTRATAP